MSLSTLVMQEDLDDISLLGSNIVSNSKFIFISANGYNIYNGLILVYYKNITIQKKCFKGIIFQQLTAWKPQYEWLESLLTKYPNCWVKNEWNEEGGIAGVWVGSVKNGIQSMCWEDLSIEAKYYIFDKNDKE